MITFLRRNVGCWEVCEDVERDKFQIPLLEFETEEELFKYINDTLPFTKNESEYKLRIVDDVVTQWTVLGFIK